MMTHWIVTEADRGSDGRILVNPFEQEIVRAMADIGGQAPLAEPEGRNTPAQRRRFGRLEIASVVGGVLLTVAVIVVLRSATLTPMPQTTPTAAPTAAPTMTIAPTIATQGAYASPDGTMLGTVPLTATLAYRYGDSEWGGIEHDGAVIWVKVENATRLTSLPDLAPPTPRPVPSRPPIEAPQAAPAPLACDPQINPRYIVAIDLSPLGSVRGVSCESQEEAAQNAEQLAAEMIAAASSAPAPIRAR
jgi:hypothetical protein